MSSSTSTPSLPLDITAVMKLLPHRYPMLLVDRLEAFIADVSATAVKAVSMNEAFFQGHFPGRPIMPGVLIVEALAQTAGAHAVLSLGPEAQGKLVYFMSIDNAKFRKPVEPGVLLHLDVELEKARGPVRRYKGVARVGETVMATAEFSAMIADPPQ